MIELFLWLCCDKLNHRKIKVLFVHQKGVYPTNEKYCGSKSSNVNLKLNYLISVIKKTWPNMLILSFGAVINIVLNFMLIPLLGIEGAGIATLIGYVVSVVVCVGVLIKMRLMILSGRFIIVSCSTVIFIILWRLFFRENFVISTLLATIITIFFVLLYKKDLLSLISGGRK